MDCPAPRDRVQAPATPIGWLLTETASFAMLVRIESAIVWRCASWGLMAGSSPAMTVGGGTTMTVGGGATYGAAGGGP
jgi:hypothetical protein